MINGQNIRSIPAEAFPVFVYSSNQRALPAEVRTESTKEAIMLWVFGGMIGVPRLGDDSQLHAALATSYAIGQHNERFGSLIRAELDRRAEARKGEEARAAMRAAEHRPPPTGPGEEPPAWDADQTQPAAKPA